MNASSSSDHHLLMGGQRPDSLLFRTVLSSMEHIYLNRNPTAKAILELVQSDQDNNNNNNNIISYDHLAFRTFGVNHHGIHSISNFFLDFGYTQRDELTFPKKKLKALWFSPPPSPSPHLPNRGRVYGPLPRIFISELLVHQLSQEAQEIIQKYTTLSGAAGHKHSALSSALGSLTWPKPCYSEFKLLASESEYAAWTLVNGYTLNHVTISTHRLNSHLNNINNFNHFIQQNGFKLNSEGGVLKGELVDFLFSLFKLKLKSFWISVSPDGLLLQSSTVADSIPFEFSDGCKQSVPCSYIEFAQRLVLPQYKHLPQHQVEEVHRRDGFEVGNADKIFESTSLDQLTRRA